MGNECPQVDRIVYEALADFSARCDEVLEGPQSEIVFYEDASLMPRNKITDTALDEPQSKKESTRR